MKKFLIRFGVLGTLVFLGYFVYYFRTSRRFRQSILSAFVAAWVFLSSLGPARAVGEADAFTPQSQQHHSSPSHNSGLFSGKSSDDGSGPGKPDGSGSNGGGVPQFPQTESVEKTGERIEKIDDYLRQMSEVSDSETESESDSEQSCELDENINMDKLANSLSPKYSEFQSEYCSELSSKRFDANDYSAKEFKELAKDPREEGIKYKRSSIDEARAIVQAKLEGRLLTQLDQIWEQQDAWI